METVRSTMKVSCCSTFCHSGKFFFFFFFILIFWKVVLCDQNDKKQTIYLDCFISEVRGCSFALLLNQFLIRESVFILYTCIECSTHLFQNVMV